MRPEEKEEEEADESAAVVVERLRLVWSRAAAMRAAIGTEWRSRERGKVRP